MNSHDRIIVGDCFHALREIETNSIHTCVTSPPYFGLRDYSVAPTLWPDIEYSPLPNVPKIHVPAMSCCFGAEPTPEAFIGHMVLIFREVRRVLRDDGTLWLNLGDSFANCTSIGRDKRYTGLKPKDLIGIPWRAAFALQADGWYLRMDNIWAKPNPMPESVTDRPTKSHEYVFLLVKVQKYFYDAEAIKEPLKDTSVARLIQDVDNQNGSDRVPRKTNGNMKAVKFGGNNLCPDTRLQSGKEWKPSMAGGGNGVAGHNGYFKTDGTPLCGITANKKSVWNVAVIGFKEAHFATFPPKLIEPCILASTSQHGCCAICGAQWQRQTKRSTEPRAGFKGSRFDSGKTGARDGGDRTQAGERYATQLIGWVPTCDCGTVETVQSVVLDPFFGAGTTGLVASRHHRRFVGIEANPEYAEMALRRIIQDAPLFSQVELCA